MRHRTLPFERMFWYDTDGGQCRFVGCYFTHCDIHHLHAWESGGNTDIDNGFYGCPRHHRMLHRGYRVEGDPNGELRFYRPDGTYLGSTHPALAEHVRRSHAEWP